MMRRRHEMARSIGTRIPLDVRRAVHFRDKGCVGPQVGIPGRCVGATQLDHVRASGGMGMKSPSVAANLVLLCLWHHEYKTLHGREIRPLLIRYLDDAMERSGTIG